MKACLTGLIFLPLGTENEATRLHRIDWLIGGMANRF
jgi:hypothetical protein